MTPKFQEAYFYNNTSSPQYVFGLKLINLPKILKKSGLDDQAHLRHNFKNLIFQIPAHLNPVKVPSIQTVNWMRQRIPSNRKTAKITMSMINAKGDRGHISPHNNYKN